MKVWTYKPPTHPPAKKERHEPSQGPENTQKHLTDQTIDFSAKREIPIQAGIKKDQTDVTDSLALKAF